MLVFSHVLAIENCEVEWLSCSIKMLFIETPSQIKLDIWPSRVAPSVTWWCKNIFTLKLLNRLGLKLSLSVCALSIFVNMPRVLILRICGVKWFTGSFIYRRD